MDNQQLSIEKLTQLLQQHTFPASVEAALIAIRECDMFSRTDLSMLANRFIFCHAQSSTNSSQVIWVKTSNNLQELHTLDIVRQFLEKQSDMKVSARVFDIIFVDVLADQRHPLFVLYYNLILKLLSLVLSFESKQTLTVIARWFLNSSTTNETLITKIIEQIIHEHIALAISTSIKNLCAISPLFTLCFITQTSTLLDNEKFTVDVDTVQTLIELFTHGLTNATNLLMITLQQELTEKNTSLLVNFLPSVIRLDVLLPLRSFESTSLRTHLDQFHTSILSFLFAIITKNAQRTDSGDLGQRNSLPADYFEQLSVTIQDSIGREGPDKGSIDECIQRCLQILTICKNPSSPLTELRIRDLGKTLPLLTRHRLFDVLKHRELAEPKKTK